MPMLEIRDIHTYYGNIHALKGVSLTVDEGEIVTLIGSNGAGKDHHPAFDLRPAETPPGLDPPEWRGSGRRTRPIRWWRRAWRWCRKGGGSSPA